MHEGGGDRAQLRGARRRLVRAALHQRLHAGVHQGVQAQYVSSLCSRGDLQAGSQGCFTSELLASSYATGLRYLQSEQRDPMGSTGRSLTFGKHVLLCVIF